MIIFMRVLAWQVCTVMQAVKFSGGFLVSNSSRFRDVEIRAPRGTQLNAKSWMTEAPLRMLMNNLDPDVAEKPEELVVYGGIGRAARNWAVLRPDRRGLKQLEDDETLLVQSGKPVGVFRTHTDAPRVLIANSNLVPALGELGALPRTRSQGPDDVRPDDGRLLDLHRQPGHRAGHLRDLRRSGRQHFGGNLKGKWILTAGLGGMGGAQPLAATMAGACMLAIECQTSRIDVVWRPVTSTESRHLTTRCADRPRHR